MARRWLQSRVTRSQSHPEYLPPWIVLVSLCAVLWVMRLVSSHPSSVCFWEQIRTSVRLLPRLGLGVTPQPPPRTAAQVPRVPCRISGSCTKRVTGDARSSPGSASGDSSCCRGLFWRCSPPNADRQPPCRAPRRTRATEHTGTAGECQNAGRRADVTTGIDSYFVGLFHLLKLNVGLMQIAYYLGTQFISSLAIRLLIVW